MKVLLMVTGALALAIAGAPARAQSPKSIELPPDNAMATLKPGPGVETVKNDCSICHSTDYIVRQPGGDAAHWQPEVEKMSKVYGAPTSAADIPTIVQYLATAYGTPPVKPADAPAGRALRTLPVGRKHMRRVPASDHP